VRLTATDGSVLSTQNTLGGSIRISLSAYEAGVYFIEVEHENQVYIEKLMKN
jgi:hypothetical protein